MNKLIGALALTITVSMTTLAQDNKEQLIDRIEQSNVWMTGYMVDKLFTINLSPTMWEHVVGKPGQNNGRDTFKRMAQSLVDFSDKAGYTSLNEKCGFGVQTDKAKEWRPTCTEQIDGLSGRLSFKFDAPDVAKNPVSAGLMLNYMGTVMKVAWSTDGQTVTVSGPASKEIAGWSDFILAGLAKGGKK
jgi:hypothetical protein